MWVIKFSHKIIFFPTYQPSFFSACNRKHTTIFIWPRSNSQKFRLWIFGYFWMKHAVLTHPASVTVVSDLLRIKSDILVNSGWKHLYRQNYSTHKWIGAYFVNTAVLFSLNDVSNGDSIDYRPSIHDQIYCQIFHIVQSYWSCMGSIDAKILY